MYNSKDLQANILKGHGRTHACFFFFRFSSNRKSKKEHREMIAKLSQELTSHKQQSLDTRALNQVKIQILNGRSNYKELVNRSLKSVVSLSLSSSGYKNLGIKDTYTPSDKIFSLGMINGDHMRHIGDYNAPLESGFEVTRANQIDGLLMVANDNRKILDQQLDKLINKYFTGHIIDSRRSPFKQYANTMRDTKGRPKEHFGYSDGFSNPKDEKETAKYSLVKESGGLKTFGSYIAFRKIQQHTAYFHTMVNDLCQKLGITDKKYAMALLMGRFPYGTAITSFNTEQHNWGQLNTHESFDYSKDQKGLKCPFNAHTRIVNPREKLPDGTISMPPIVRRSMTFDEGDKDKGLCFVSYQSSIESNLFPIFRRMVGIKPDGTNMLDPDGYKSFDAITYRPRKMPKASYNCDNVTRGRDILNCSRFAKVYDDPSKGYIRQVLGGTNLTEFKGGEYFFVPSLPFLKNIDQYA